jgi:quinoprotein glucose dehydrogenase
MTVDEELGLVYLPVESPTSDYYGGERPGDNLFGESLVCVDLKTGKRKWHFQFVHHPIWDYDMSSAPILADINVDGKAIKAVAVPSKQSMLYVFDRVTGQPVWPIVEKPVPQSDVPLEKTSPTQPFPTKPPAYGRNFFNVPDDLIDFTPELRAQAKDNIARYKTGPMYLPPVIGDPKTFLGAINLGNASGGTNWPGGGYDPETHTVYAEANQSAVTPISLRIPPPGFTDIHYTMGRNDTEFRVSEGPGFGSAADAPQPKRPRTPPPAPAAPAAAPVGALTVQGLSIIKPPYAVISAIDLDKGDLKWKVPYGETPDVVRNHPALKGLNLENTGQPGSVGLVVTKTLVILGDSQLTTTPAHPRGAMLRAYDKSTGKEVGAVYMPAPQSGSPMTYMLDGKQYLVVAVSGGAYSGEYIAYRLPSED